MNFNKVTDGLLGVAVGDALGVPFEFTPRAEMEKSPAKGLTGYGTYSQPEGTWSDDSSLTFCLAESLAGGYDLEDMAKNFIAWIRENHWTARGNVFDIGNTTLHAISRLTQIIDSGTLEDLKLQKFLGDVNENGNGALMRILPLLFYIKGKNIKEQFDIIWEVAALTHRHIRSAMSCTIYLKMAEYLLSGSSKEESYKAMQRDIFSFWDQMEFSKAERAHFNRVIQNDVRDIAWKDLKSGGYVIESLEASLWCFLIKDSYEDIILSAINLGHDTDTTAAIAGGLAGLHYGTKNIPEYWLVSLARMEDIIDLGSRLHDKYTV